MAQPDQSQQRHETSSEHQHRETGDPQPEYTERERQFGSPTINAGRGMLTDAAEATGALATTAVRSVVNVGEEVIQGIGTLANEGVVEISRFLVTAATGIRGAIGTMFTGRPPQDLPWLGQGRRDTRQQQYTRSPSGGSTGPHAAGQQTGETRSGTTI
jgi:hypothetical protein